MRRIKRMIFKNFNCIPWFIVGIQIGRRRDQPLAVCYVLDLHSGNDLGGCTKQTTSEGRWESC